MNSELLLTLEEGNFIVYKRRKADIFYGKVIEIFQKKFGFSEKDSEYIHVEVSLGKGHSLNAAIPVIKERNVLDSREGQYVKIVKPKLLGYQLHRKDVVIHCLKRKGMVYGLGIIWFVCKKWLKTNVFSFFGDFCSELCGLGIYKEYVEKLNFRLEQVLPRHFSKLYPADFLNSQYFEVIWEGIISKND